MTAVTPFSWTNGPSKILKPSVSSLVVRRPICYATGRAAEHAWSRRAGPWRRIEARSVQRWHNALAAEYFCAGGVTIHGAEEGVAALRRGGHPRADRAAGD